MKLVWKAAALASLAIAGISAAAPAQAQNYGGWRGDRDYRRDYRSDHRRWDNNRRWDDRRHWRGDRRDWRGNRGYRQRCWTEWRYDRYRDRDVRVRICR